MDKLRQSIYARLLDGSESLGVAIINAIEEIVQLEAEIETLNGKVAALENDVLFEQVVAENTRLKATIAELEKYISDHSEKEYQK